jgi:hypothetical protein
LLAPVFSLPDPLTLSKVKEIAKVLGITPAQVILSWHVQRGVSEGLLLFHMITNHITASGCCLAKKCDALQNQGKPSRYEG